jgi:VWFA-related protein
VCAAALHLVLPGAASAQPPGYAERVDVARVVIDVHALESDGRPIRGLTRDSFRVRVDGTPVPVLEARWTTQAVADRGAPPAAVEAAPPSPDLFGLPSGRQIVLLYQKDFEPTRMEGLVDLLRRTRALVAGLHADDRVAVLSFGMRLTLWCDFTADRALVDAVLERGILLHAPPADVPVTGAPSLALHYDQRAARDASSMERALLVLARALMLVPGSKSLVVVGHGFGRAGIGAPGSLSAPMVFEEAYDEAARLLMASRTTVFCLDTTRAASHALEVGLQRVAADTGGFFARTQDFPVAALRRLGEALAGRYEVVIEKPALPPGQHRITVELAGRKGLILARRSYVG